jgi:hypothetical protein
MSGTRTLKVFTDDQLDLLQKLLATKVVHMGGRKFEEGDWNEIYCDALGIPPLGWSNLNIDAVNGNIGVEQKQVCVKSKIDDIRKTCGTSMMHPSLTRSIRIEGNTSNDPNATMADVFRQYDELMEERKAFIRTQSALPEDAAVAMRVGWLLWQESLRQFLYFEELTVVPDPADYYAVWQQNKSKGTRKASLSLWIFEKAEPHRKRYSVTTTAGAKIQPYFDVPAPDDPNLYVFTVIGEVVNDKYVRAWVTERTRRDLEDTVGTLDPNALSAIILKGTEGGLDHAELFEFMRSEERAASVEVTPDAYGALCETFKAVNDELRFRALIVHLKRESS